MSEHPTIFPEAASTAASKAVNRGDFGLSPRLLQQARTRLQGLAIMLMCLAGLPLVISLLVVGSPRGWWVNVGAIVITGSLIFVTQHRYFSDLFALNYGLVWEVLITLLISVGLSQLTYNAGGSVADATWTCIVIIAFPLIVPLPPRHMVVAAVLSALTVPLSLFLLQVTHGAQFEVYEWVGACFDPAVSVAISGFGSRVIYGISRDVSRARELGSYRIEEQIGVGGMGEVWRASHRMLARPAAIKLIRPDAVATDSAGLTRSVERFEREANVTASLRSPHTVGLYDYGRTHEGQVYYVMELLDGLNLESLVRKHGPVPPERAVFLLRQVCHSLREAHGAGLIHRDIKPANIFCSRHGIDHDFVKVLDFGLVSLQRQRGGERELTALTAEGNIAGTPAYIPPEIAASRKDLDGRADLYALGCVAFWLVTGRPPFEADTPLAVVLAHVTDEPLPPSRCSELEIPAAFDAVVLRCLQKDPAQRPEDAAALDALLASVPFERPWGEEQARRWWQTHYPHS